MTGTVEGGEDTEPRSAVSGYNPYSLVRDRVHHSRTKLSPLLNDSFSKITPRQWFVCEFTVVTKPHEYGWAAWSPGKGNFYVVLWRLEMTTRKGTRNEQRLKCQQKHRARKKAGMGEGWAG